MENIVWENGNHLIDELDQLQTAYFKSGSYTSEEARRFEVLLRHAYPSMRNLVLAGQRAVGTSKMRHKKTDEYFKAFGEEEFVRGYLAGEADMGKAVERAYERKL